MALRKTWTELQTLYVIRDNGQFACEKFSNFANEWGSSTYQGVRGTNRQVARQTQLFKRRNAFCAKPRKPR